MAMGDEEEVLSNSLLGAATNIKGQIKGWEDYASFMASNGQTLNWVSFNLHSLLRFHRIRIGAFATTSGSGFHGRNI